MPRIMTTAIHKKFFVPVKLPTCSAIVTAVTGPAIRIILCLNETHVFFVFPSFLHNLINTIGSVSNLKGRVEFS